MWGRTRVVSGKGLTLQAAEEGCFHEAIERQSAVFDPEIRLTHASARVLAGKSVDPRHILNISDAQYAARADWNEAVAADHALPSPFSDDLPIGWTEARSLDTDETMLVPAAATYLGYPQALRDGFPVPDSSGLASGRTWVEATEKALLELIERDAVSMWWYNRARRPSMPERLIEGEYLQSFSNWIARCNRKFWILDLTHDLAVPVAVAVSCDENGTDVSLGFAAAYTMKQAAQQAIGELVQFEATKQNFGPAVAERYPHLVSWCRSITISETPFLGPCENSGTGLSATPPTFDSTLAQLKSGGLEAFVIEFPQCDAGAHTVRVITPGLRSVWPRFAPGRLYDSPVACGWIAQPLQEAQLNPIPMLY